MTAGHFQLEGYGYSLPEDLIAQYPAVRRDHARLMIVDRKGSRIRHDIFARIGRYLPAKTLIAANNSRVVPARLKGRKEKTGGEVEVFLLKPAAQSGCFEVLLKPLKKIREGELIELEGGLKAVLIDKAKRIVRFETKNVRRYLEKSGHIPLPPYVKRDDEPSDRRDYQTVYAKRAGSVACPTAGLHFTKALLTSLSRQGHAFKELTLHINYGTFKPVECADIRDHAMHKEEYILSAPVHRSLLKAKEAGRPILAVGTTSCRVLESAAASGRLEGETDLFIYPGFEFRMVDMLITNFHLPHSTLLMLVCAFGGYDLIMRAYREAVKEKYRFYSYGDAMLIL